MYDFSGSSYDSHSFGNSSHDIDNKLRYSWSSSTYHSNAPRTHKRDNLTRHSSMKDSLYKCSNLSSQRPQYKDRSSHKHSSSLPYHLQLSPYTKSVKATPHDQVRMLFHFLPFQLITTPSANLQVPTSPQDTNTPHSNQPRRNKRPQYNHSPAHNTKTNTHTSHIQRIQHVHHLYFSSPSPPPRRRGVAQAEGKKWEVDPEPDDEAEQEKIRKKDGGKQSLLSKILNFLKS
ncbi:hypothetical protein BDQ17DRAFT_1373764 [Cyathus striatus]|nr:hypothetical protein BDQ17DRAFT_1373764 [Cyathus striatus]